MKPRWIVGPLALALALTAPAAAAEWPQWLGPNRDAVWPEKGTLDKLPEGGPKVLWRKPVGTGYAGPAVAGGKAYLMDRQAKGEVPKGKAALGTLPGTERVLCLDAKTGEELWAHEYDCPYVRISYPEGPRTTPVVEGGRVYTLGTMGDMLCLDANTGKVIWAKHLMKDSGLKPKDAEEKKDDPDGIPKPPVEYNVTPPIWGYSAHILLDGDKLITLVGGAGGAVRAFDKKTGKELWKALNSEEVGYSPPVIAEAGGKRQLVVWLSDLLAGLNPDTGEVYWRIKHPDLPAGQKQMRPAVTIVTPTVADGMVFVSTAYEGTCAVKLDKDRPTASIAWKAEKVYPKESEKLPTLMTTLLHRDGHLYGIDTKGKVKCLKAATGEQVWEDHTMFGEKDTLFGTAFWVWNGEKVFALTDLGDLVICKLTPKGYEELGRAHVIDPVFSTRGRRVVWSHPSFADGCMIARNNQEVVCVSLTKG